jgi:hypothetical protein
MVTFVQTAPGTWSRVSRRQPVWSAGQLNCSAPAVRTTAIGARFVATGRIQPGTEFELSPQVFTALMQ